jgi:hypothetical protein
MLGAPGGEAQGDGAFLGLIDHDQEFTWGARGGTAHESQTNILK